MSFFDEMVTVYRMKYPDIGDQVDLTYKGKYYRLYVSNILDHCVFLLNGSKDLPSPLVMVLHRDRWSIWGGETKSQIELPASKVRTFSLVYKMPMKQIINHPIVINVGDFSYTYKIHDVNVEEQYMTLQGEGNFFFKTYLVSGKWKIPMLRHLPESHNIKELIPPKEEYAW